MVFNPIRYNAHSSFEFDDGIDMNRREFMLGAAGVFLGMKDAAASAEQRIHVGTGQFTPYGYTDQLMNWQVLYRCGLNLEIESSPVLQSILRQSRDLSDLKRISGLVVSDELYNAIIPRLPGKLEFVKSVFDPKRRPYLVAPDTHDLDQATGVHRDPWDYIGRKVTIQKKNRIFHNDSYYDATWESPAYIFDVMADEDRNLEENRHFFCDADPHTYRTFLGIHIHTEPPYFRTADGNEVSSLPYISLSCNTDQFV